VKERNLHVVSLALRGDLDLTMLVYLKSRQEKRRLSKKRKNLEALRQRLDSVSAKRVMRGKRKREVYIPVQTVPLFCLSHFPSHRLGCVCVYWFRFQLRKSAWMLR
jgi:hypothetical protein